MKANENVEVFFEMRANIVASHSRVKNVVQKCWQLTLSFTHAQGLILVLQVEGLIPDQSSYIAKKNCCTDGF